MNPITDQLYIQMVNLPAPDATCPKGKELVASGWGADAYNRSRKTERLWAVFQECLPNEKCRLFHDDVNYVCGGDSTRSDNSICFGDSGGDIFS